MTADIKRVKSGILIGKVAARTGIAVSAIRFYEEAGLVTAGRNKGGQRVFEAGDIRRISFIIISQKLGFTLKEIKQHLDKLPHKRTPTLKDWETSARVLALILTRALRRLPGFATNSRAVLAVAVYRCKNARSITPMIWPRCREQGQGI